MVVQGPCQEPAAGRPPGPEALARVSAAPLQKAGHCPRVEVPLAVEPCVEITECSSDSQCAGSKKCCLSVCALRCLDPAAGERPRPAPSAGPAGPQRLGWLDWGWPTSRVCAFAT